MFCQDVLLYSRSNVGQFTCIVQHDSILANIADFGTERAEVTVSTDSVQPIEILCRRVEKVLGRRKVLIIQVVLCNPLSNIRKTGEIISKRISTLR